MAMRSPRRDQDQMQTWLRDLRAKSQRKVDVSSVLVALEDLASTHKDFEVAATAGDAIGIIRALLAARRADRSKLKMQSLVAFDSASSEELKALTAMTDGDQSSHGDSGSRPGSSGTEKRLRLMLEESDYRRRQAEAAARAARKDAADWEHDLQALQKRLADMKAAAVKKLDAKQVKIDGLQAQVDELNELLGDVKAQTAAWAASIAALG